MYHDNTSLVVRLQIGNISCIVKNAFVSAINVEFSHKLLKTNRFKFLIFDIFSGSFDNFFNLEKNN